MVIASVDSGRSRIHTLGDIVSFYKHKTRKYRPELITPLPPPSVRPSERLADRHGNDFSRIIRRVDSLPTFDDISSIASRINLKFDSFHGARPASGSVNGAQLSRVGHYERSWYRDMALLADSMFDIGLDKEGTDILFRIFKFANSPQQREKYYDNFVAKGRQESWERYKEMNTAIFHPHIVAARNDSGDLSKSDIEWGHAQLDGIALSLWVLFFRANQGKINLLDFNEKLNTVDYSEYPATSSGSTKNYNEKESIMVLMMKFLSYTNAAHQPDFGTWEEYRHPKRLSTAAAITAASLECRKHFTRANWNPKETLNIAEGYGIEALNDDLTALNAAGDWVMENRIPVDGSSSARETDEQLADGSYSWILALLNKTLNLSPNQQEALINGVRHLGNEWGTVRYKNDRYLGKGYMHNGTDRLMAHIPPNEPYQEATWPLFDAYMAKYYFDRHAKTGFVNRRFLSEGLSHSGRVFSQVTVPLNLRNHIHGEAYIEGGFLPEANSLDPYDDQNPAKPPAHAAPLLWAEAATASMTNSLMNVIGYEREI